MEKQEIAFQVTIQKRGRIQIPLPTMKTLKSFGIAEGSTVMIKVEKVEE